MLMNKTQKGFALIEGLLITLILAIIAFGGYYVWHTQTTTDKSSKAAVSASQSTPSSSTSSGYLTIKEWGVRAPYNGALSLSYKIDRNTAGFSSTQLSAAANGGCSGYGGYIMRLLPNDLYLPGTETAAQVAAEPESAGTYKLLDGYYYFFVHNQALCPDIQLSDSNAADLQGKTSDAVKAITTNLEAIPK